MESFRLFYHNLSGRSAHNFNFAGDTPITNRSAVSVTAAPCQLIFVQPGEGPIFIDDLDLRLNVHGPDVRVSNVVAHGSQSEAGGVEFILTVDQPTDVAVTITNLGECGSSFRV